jgi:repressor LexA
MPNNIRELRNKKGLTMRELADRMGIHHTTIAKLERSERRLSMDWVEKIAKALEVSINELIGTTKGLPSIRTVPLVGKIPAGGWREAISEPMGEVPAPAGGPNAFALEPDGDSMNRVFAPGSYVIIDPDEITLYDGKVYAVSNGEGDATLKRFRSDPPRLEPDSDNDQHQPMLLGSEPFQVIGRVIWSMMAM